MWRKKPSDGFFGYGCGCEGKDAAGFRRREPRRRPERGRCRRAEADGDGQAGALAHGRHLGKLGERRIHVIPRLGDGCENISRRLVQARVIEAPCRNHRQVRHGTGFSEQIRAAFRTKTTAEHVAAVGFRVMILDRTRDLQRRGRQSDLGRVRAAARLLAIAAVAIPHKKRIGGTFVAHPAAKAASGEFRSHGFVSLFAPGRSSLPSPIGEITYRRLYDLAYAASVPWSEAVTQLMKSHIIDGMGKTLREGLFEKVGCKRRRTWRLAWRHQAVDRVRPKSGSTLSAGRRQLMPSAA